MFEDLDVFDFICAAVLIIGLLVVIPVTLTSLINYIRLSRISRANFFLSRQPSLVILINVLSMLILLIERPLLAFYDVFSFSFNHFSNNDNMYHWILELIHSMTWFGLLTAFCIKFYLLYFNQQLSLAVINSTWQKQINAGVTGT